VSLHSYAALGLCLESDTPLPGLPRADRSSPQVHVQADPGRYEARRAATDAEARCTVRRVHADALVLHESEDQTLFDFEWWDHNRFLVELADTVTITGHRPDDSSPDWFTTYLTGPLLGFAARLLGVTVLHGSALELDGRTLAFVGHGGDGKSTLTVSLAGRGGRVVTDDVCAVDVVDDRALVRLGPRRVRLWEDSAEVTGRPDAPLIAPDWGKRFVDDTHVDFAERAQPLDAIFVLSEDEAPVRLSPHEATLALLERVSGDYLTTRAMRARELGAIAELVERVPVLTLPRAPTPARVHERADLAIRALEAL
jgi:hypothetical protein